MSTPEERIKIWRQEREAADNRRRTWAQERRAKQPPASAPTAPTAPVTTGENIAIGGERGYRKYLEPSVSSIAEVTEAMKVGDFGPAWQMAKEAARGAYQALTPPNPQVQRDASGNVTGMTMRPTDPTLQAAQAQRQARYQASPEGQRSRERLAELDQRAAQDPSLAGKVTRGATELLTGAAPTLAAAVASRGALPIISVAAAAQSANNPAMIGPNVAAGVLPVPVGKFVAPILRRIRAGKGATAAVEEEIAPVARQLTPATGEPLPAQPVERAMSRFEQEVQRISASNLTPKQKAVELDAAIQSISREARGLPDSALTGESMVQSRFPRQRGAPPMIMPENPNPVQQAGVLPEVFEPQASMRGPASTAAMDAEFNPPGIYEADISPPSFEVKAAPDVPFTETKGPRLEEMGYSAPADPALVTKAERTPILETISAFIKAGMLTKPTTHLKNVGGTGLFQLSEEAARIPGAIADMMASFRTGRRTLTGPNVGSMSRSFQEAATEGLAQAKQAIRTGRTKFDIEGLQEINSGSEIINKYVNGVFRLLKAEDVFFRAYAARRALEERARALTLTEIRQGKIPRGDYGRRAKEIIDAPPADLQAGALADAEMATFNNDNFISEKVVGPIRAGLQNSTKYPKLSKAVEFGIDRIFPFTKTPTNVIARMLEYSGVTSAPKALYLSRKLFKGVMTEAEQRAFAQSFGRANVGVGLITLGWKLYRAGKMTGLIEDDPTRRARDMAAGRTPGSIKVGDSWLQVTGVAPLGSLLAIGATLARETEQESEGGGILPVLETVGQTVAEQPLLIGTKQIGEALAKPGTVGEKVLGGVLGTTVPGIVSDLAEAVDPTQRETTGITGRFQSRIPGLRNTLPAAQDVLGQPRQDTGPAQAFLDPTRTQNDVASTNRLFAELVRLDEGISGFQKDKGENEEAYRTRQRDFGQLYSQYGLQLASSSQYQRATDAIKRKALKILGDRAKDIVRREQQRYAAGPLSPAAIIGSALGSQAREQRKSAARK